MMHYLGAMQFIIKKIAIVMQVLMGTTAGESLNAAGNIFIGQVYEALCSLKRSNREEHFLLILLTQFVKKSVE